MTTYRFDAVIFDFDGVLAESVDVKTRAFAALYSEHGLEVVEKVVAYHLEHGGVSRFEKFRYFHETLLGVKLSPDLEQSLGDRFSRLVEDAVVSAPWVEGAQEFLENCYQDLPLFVASGTPEEELKRILEKRAMGHYFTSAYGAPETKGQIIRRILDHYRFPHDRVLMMGDAQSDYDGAAETGVCFIGRIHRDSAKFPPTTQTVPDLRTLADLVTE
ncbi:MAG: HAD family hydrolase [Burkholderiales bacterium]